MNSAVVPEILVVTDNLRGTWAAGVRRTGNAAQVLPLGIDPTLLRRAVPSGNWRVVEPGAAVERARAQVREAVPRLVDELPSRVLPSGHRLGPFFEDGRDSVWWLLEFAERSPLRGAWIGALFGLALVREVLERSSGSIREIWLDLDDAALTAAIEQGTDLPAVRTVGRSQRGASRPAGLARYAAMALATALFHASNAAALIRVSAGLQATAAIGFFSFFPAWWSRPFATDAAEWFFGTLPEAVGRRVSARFLLWWTGGPVGALRQRKAVQRLARERGAVFLHQVLGPAGVWGVLQPRHLRRFVQIRCALRGLRVSFAGFDIGSLISAEILRSMTSPEFFMDLLLREAIDRLSARGEVRAFVYRLEFQPFEHALLMGLGGRAPAVAIQHSTFGRNYLPYFFPGGGLSRERHAGRPLPSLVVTAGSRARDIMVDNGLPPGEVEITGAVRYARLLNHSRRAGSRDAARAGLDLPAHISVMLVTTSVVRTDSQALMACLAEALPRLQPAPFLLFKGHPAQPLDEIFLRWVAPQAAGGFRILSPDAGLSDVLPAADVALLTGSTVAVEAMLLRVVPVVFESRYLFDAKAMDYLDGACVTVADADELVAALGWILTDGAQVARLRQRWAEVIAALFDDVHLDPTSRFVEILHRRGIVP